MKKNFTITNSTIEIKQGNILTLPVTAIVNPANNQLSHGGGLAAKIVETGGSIIQTESNTLAPVPTGESVITRAGNLPCQFIIHTVGPRQGEGEEDKKIYKAFISILRIADKLNFQSIAIPAISTGIFRYPTKKAAFYMKKAFFDFLPSHSDTALKKIYVVLYELSKYKIFLHEFNK